MVFSGSTVALRSGRWDHGTVRPSSVLAWVLTVGAVCLGVFGFVLGALAGSDGSSWLEDVLGFSAVFASVAVGLLIAIRHEGHPIGWLLLVNGLVIALSGLAAGYAWYAVIAEPGALPGAGLAVRWDQAAWPMLFAPITAVVFLFPDGHLPSPRWRWVGYFALAAFAGVTAISLLDPDVYDPPFRGRVSAPEFLPAWVRADLMLPFLFAMLVSLVAAAAAIVTRFRRSTGIERLQLKWLAYAVSLIPAALLVGLLEAALTGNVDVAGGLSLAIALTAIPIAIGIAVLRYRLYEIDRIINRTLVYGVLTLLLAAAYAAGTLVLGTALGSGSAWATAGATLMVAVAFRPLRERVQDVVDRRFSRARYERLRRIDAFLEALRAGRAAPEGVEEVLREVLSDPDLEVHFWLPESEIYVDARGQPVPDAPGDARLRTPVERAGSPLGMVVHESVDDESPELLSEVVEAAGLAIEIARLRVELRRQLDEVEASRARIVSAGYEERRRIERDLHDGAQQRLVSIGLELRHVQHELGPVANGAGQALDVVVDELGRAIGDLRELARGVRPTQLDQGLLPALRELAVRAPVPVEVSATPDRLPDDVEAAAYFIASEGLTNAIKHARASKVRLEAQRGDGTLVVQVSDDGVGGARGSQGSGLPGLEDRVAAHAGTLELDSEPGRGTTLRAVLPCV
jgi:signal transduction histidine kinase